LADCRDGIAGKLAYEDAQRNAPQHPDAQIPFKFSHGSSRFLLYRNIAIKGRKQSVWEMKFSESFK
jgi:hypothetical protein